MVVLVKDKVGEALREDDSVTGIDAGIDAFIDCVGDRLVDKLVDDDGDTLVSPDADIIYDAVLLDVVVEAEVVVLDRMDCVTDIDAVPEKACELLTETLRDCDTVIDNDADFVEFCAHMAIPTSTKPGSQGQ